LQTHEKRITFLEEENEALQASLKNLQGEIEGLKTIVDDVNFKQGAANTSSERTDSELLKTYIAHMLNSNVTVVEELNFFGIKERKNETMTLNSP